MLTFILQFLLRIAGTEVAKSAIGYGINRLLTDTSDGITKDIATIMIDGIAKSKANPTKIEMFDEAYNELRKETFNA